MQRISTRYIVNSRGRKTAVVLPIKDFGRLMDRLEELEDALALDEAVQNAVEFSDYRELRDELRKEGRL